VRHLDGGKVKKLFSSAVEYIAERIAAGRIRREKKKENRSHNVSFFGYSGIITSVFFKCFERKEKDEEKNANDGGGRE
jgi:hypothetical protein